MQPIMTTAARRKAQYNQHVQDYYNLTEPGCGKFEGERLAVRIAYNASLEGMGDDFGDMNAQGYYCKVDFEEYPFTIYFWVNSQGFVTEITKAGYLAAQHEYETCNEYEE
jgi:hypothetical protein